MDLLGGIGDLVESASDFVGLPESVGDALGIVTDLATGNEFGAAMGVLDLMEDVPGFEQLGQGMALCGGGGLAGMPLGDLVEDVLDEVGAPEELADAAAYMADACRGDMKGALEHFADLGEAVPGMSVVSQSLSMYEQLQRRAAASGFSLEAEFSPSEVLAELKA